jgi:acyl-CoA thioesterase FadM
VAAGFDAVLIFAAVCIGHPGVTGSLTVRYRRPTPLGVDLVYEARPDRIDGRKAFIAGKLLDPDGHVCVEAEGTFVLVERDRFLHAAE